MSLDRTHSLEISRHADLKTRADGSVLVLPERAIRIGGSGAEILRLVEEGQSVEFVLTEMFERYPDSSEIEGEILRFLEEMLVLGGIRVLDERVAKTS